MRLFPDGQTSLSPPSDLFAESSPYLPPYFPFSQQQTTTKNSDLAEVPPLVSEAAADALEVTESPADAAENQEETAQANEENALVIAADGKLGDTGLVSADVAMEYYDTTTSAADAATTNGTSSAA